MESQKHALNVSFLTTMPSPYTQDLFRAMQRDGRICPRVFYLEMAPPDTYWGAVQLPDYATVLPGFGLSLLGGRVHINPGVIRQLAAVQSDAVVIGGYAGWANQAAMRWLHRQRIPWVFWGEIPGLRRRRGVGAALRWLAQRAAVRWPDGIAAIGSGAATAYRELSHGRCPVANIPYCCDMEPFLAIRREARGIGQPVRFLYCGQLIHRKGVDLLLDAFCQAAVACRQIELTLVGEGPLRSALEAYIPESLRSRIRFAGFQPVAKLPEYFADADVFVLPSRHDGWGVVINQAVAAAMPVICTDAVGAAIDLVAQDENGFLVAVDDSRQIAEAMVWFATHPERILSLGCRSRERAVDWIPERTVDRWYELLQQIACHENSARYCFN